MQEDGTGAMRTHASRSDSTACITVREHFIGDLRRLVDSQAVATFMSLGAPQRAVALLMISWLVAKHDAGIIIRWLSWPRGSMR